MNTTTDIKDHFGTLYYAKSALVFYETKGTENDMYVEHFDMDSNGMPINGINLKSCVQIEISFRFLQ